MTTLYIYYDPERKNWVAATADETGTEALYVFAGTNDAQVANIRTMAADMARNDAADWNGFFEGVGDNAEIGWQLMDVEQIYYGEGQLVWAAPEAEPTMTALLDLERAGAEFVEILA